MIRKLRLGVVAAVAVLAVTGCASVKVQHPRVDNVKTVAIVAYTGTVDMRTQDEKDGKGGGIGGMVNGIKGISEMASGELQNSRRTQAEQTYAMLSKKLAESNGWKVVERDAIAANAEYAKHLAANPNEGITVIGLQFMPNLMREEIARQLTPAQRAELLKSLGVDAIALVRVQYVLGDTSGFSLGGVGKITKYPKAITQVALYDGAGEDEAWKDSWAEGEVTKEGFAQTMGVNSDEGETPILMTAADSSLSKLIERYQKAGK
jgi:hypothetical protein